MKAVLNRDESITVECAQEIFPLGWVGGMLQLVAGIAYKSLYNDVSKNLL